MVRQMDVITLAEDFGRTGYIPTPRGCGPAAHRLPPLVLSRAAAATLAMCGSGRRDAEYAQSLIDWVSNVEDWFRSRSTDLRQLPRHKQSAAVVRTLARLAGRLPRVQAATLDELQQRARARLPQAQLAHAETNLKVREFKGLEGNSVTPRHDPAIQSYLELRRYFDCKKMSDSDCLCILDVEDTSVIEGVAAALETSRPKSPKSFELGEAATEASPDEWSLAVLETLGGERAADERWAAAAFVREVERWHACADSITKAIVQPYMKDQTLPALVLHACKRLAPAECQEWARTALDRVAKIKSGGAPVPPGGAAPLIAEECEIDYFREKLEGEAGSAELHARYFIRHLSAGLLNTLSRQPHSARLTGLFQPVLELLRRAEGHCIACRAARQENGLLARTLSGHWLCSENGNGFNLADAQLPEVFRLFGKLQMPAHAAVLGLVEPSRAGPFDHAWLLANAIVEILTHPVRAVDAGINLTTFGYLYGALRTTRGRDDMTRRKDPLHALPLEMRATLMNNISYFNELSKGRMQRLLRGVPGPAPVVNGACGLCLQIEGHVNED